MKKNRFYIKTINVQGRKIPLISFITLWLLMDRLNAAEWIQGIYWFIVAIIIGAQLYDMAIYSEEAVDIETFLKERHEEQQQKKKVQ